MMQSFKATIALGAFLSAGVFMAPQALTAQQANPNPAPDPGIAQPAPAPPPAHAPNPNKQARHLGRMLGLTSDQVAQIRPILADRMQQMQSLRSDASLTPRDRRRRTREIMQNSNSKIEALLNDSQRQQYAQMLAQRRAHHKNGSAPVPQG